MAERIHRAPSCLAPTASQASTLLRGAVCMTLRPQVQRTGKATLPVTAADTAGCGDTAMDS